MISKAVQISILLLISFSVLGQMNKSAYYTHQSHNYFDQDRLKDAELYADSALTLAIRSTIPDSISNAYRWKYEIHFAKKEYEAALRDFKMAVTYRDSAIIRLFIRRDILNSLKADSVQETHRIEMDSLRKEIAGYQNLASQDSRNLYVMFFGVLAFSLIVLFFFYKRNDRLLIENVYQKDQIDKLDTSRRNFYEILLKEKEIISESQSSELKDTWDQIVQWVGYQIEQRGILPTSFDCKPLAEEILQRFSKKLSEKNLQADLFIPDDQQVYADREMITVVLENLILNSIRFTKAGGRITIFSGKNNDLVTLGIKDSGIGMNENEKHKLFSLQSKGNPLNAGTEGLGIGLILSKYLVERNGGVMYVESEEGQGSSFYFSIPGKKS